MTSVTYWNARTTHPYASLGNGSDCSQGGFEWQFDEIKSSHGYSGATEITWVDEEQKHSSNMEPSAMINVAAAAK